MNLSGRTFPMSIVSIAFIMFPTTPCMFDVTFLMVTAVSTRPRTASTLLASPRRFSDSFWLRIAFDAYILALTWSPSWSCCIKTIASRITRQGMKGVPRTFLTCSFAFLLFCNSFAESLFSCLTVNCGHGGSIQSSSH